MLSCQAVVRAHASNPWVPRFAELVGKHRPDEERGEGEVRMVRRRTWMSDELTTGCARLALLALTALGGSGCDEEPAGAPPRAPTDLMVTMASGSAISLSWTASATPGVTSYHLERMPVGTSTFMPVADVAGGATLIYSDASIDPSAAYTYRVRAVDGKELVSEPSNEDTAGPPPAGLQVAAATPTDQGTVYRYGVHTSLALDENEDPAIAYVGEFSTSSSGDTAKLYFVRWNRTDYRWGAPLLVDELGGLNLNHPNRQVSLARDVNNGRYGIAYTVGYDQIWLALSGDGGLTWAKEQIDLDDAGSDAETSNPSLAMANGETHVAYWHWCIKAWQEDYTCASVNDSHAVVYMHRAGVSGSFTFAISPSLPQTQDAKPWLDMALDENGEPGIAYFLGAMFGLGSPDWYNVTLAFWRPGQTASLVTDSVNQQNDTSSVSLVFLGTRPVVAYHLGREAPPTANDLWLSQPTDGSIWGTPLPLPRDGSDITIWYQSLATDSADNAFIAAYFMAGSGNGQFGGPKILRSSDLTSWTLSSPDATLIPDFAGEYVDTAYAGNDKLNMVFFYSNTGAELDTGVVFWREP
ncbi:MAG: hypothetical protein A2289_20470 [Deltaproteobacteria bacterium RIFOXYA12_FULL_58_15]|nr:MAG: hypothetical protein A2289_20470 [Deltaproteobacteria bacterium RIFOXYA12_FULL_58_15]